MCIDLWEWAENVFCVCVCLTMLTRDHPPQRRHSTTRWTEWLTLWMPVGLSPWLPQSWHGRALKWVTMMAGINDKQKQTSWAHPFKADLATDTVACLTYQQTLSPQYGIIIHRDQPGIWWQVDFSRPFPEQLFLTSMDTHLDMGLLSLTKCLRQDHHPKTCRMLDYQHGDPYNLASDEGNYLWQRSVAVGEWPRNSLVLVCTTSPRSI